MNQSKTLQPSGSAVALNKIKTFFSKPHNVILLLMGIVLTFSTVAPSSPSSRTPSRSTRVPSTPTSPVRLPAIPW